MKKADEEIEAFTKEKRNLRKWCDKAAKYQSVLIEANKKIVNDHREFRVDHNRLVVMVERASPLTSTRHGLN